MVQFIVQLDGSNYRKNASNTTDVLSEMLSLPLDAILITSKVSIYSIVWSYFIGIFRNNPHSWSTSIWKCHRWTAWKSCCMLQNITRYCYRERDEEYCKCFIWKITANIIYFQAFCCISTGVYGYPNDDAAKTVTNFLTEYLEKNDTIERIVLVTFLDIDNEHYNKYFGDYAASKDQSIA